jgi:hypothetical protein
MDAYYTVLSGWPFHICRYCFLAAGTACRYDAWFNSWRTYFSFPTFIANQIQSGMNKIKAVREELPCRVCGNLTFNRFNISFSPAPICEHCACAITQQQVDWMIDLVKAKHKQ